MHTAYMLFGSRSLQGRAYACYLCDHSADCTLYLDRCEGCSTDILAHRKDTESLAISKPVRGQEESDEVFPLLLLEPSLFNSSVSEVNMLCLLLASWKMSDPEAAWRTPSASKFQKSRKVFFEDVATAKFDVKFNSCVVT